MALITTFEEPAKTEMVSRCEIAIDLAGYELVDPPEKIQLPETSELRGGLKGDLQSLDREGSRYCYYVRPNELRVLPTWLANLAGVSHEIPETKFYIVVAETNPSLERSCRAAGAGLLLLSEDNEFEHLLDFDAIAPEIKDEVFVVDIKNLRSELVTKRDLNLGIFQRRFERIGELTAGMSEKRAASYRKGAERLYRQWSDWAREIGIELDRVLAERDVGRLSELHHAIESGPLLDDDL